MATLTYSDTDYSGKVRSRLVITYTTTANTDTSYTLSISIKHEVKASAAGIKVESVAGSYPYYGYVLFYVYTNTDTVPKTVVISQKSVTCTAANTWYTLGTYSKTITVSKEKYENEIRLDAIDWVSAGDYNDGTSYTAVDNDALNKTLVTVPALPSYAVKYDANGGSGAPAQQTKYYGTALTLSSTKPTRTNYVFRYWYTTKAGTGGTSYAPGASYTANAALTLYAQWYAPYTVTYNANGGTGGPTTQTKVYNSNLTLTTSKPTRSGYAFVKWNTKSDGTGTSYNSGATYSTNANVTLYAIWAAVPSIGTLTAVRCDENGNQDDEGSYATVTCTWSCAESSAITGTVTPQSGGSATAFAFGTNPSGSGSVTSTALVGNGNGMVLDTDMQYTVSVTVTCITSGVTKTATRNVILTRAFFVMDWKAGGKAVGIGRAAPESGLEVGYESVFDDDVTVLGHLASKGTMPIIYFDSNGRTPYSSYIVAYDTNTEGQGHNMVIKSGGNMFLGGGESPAALYNLTKAGSATDVPSLQSESPVLSSDTWLYLFSNCGTVADRQRIAFGGEAGLLEIPGNLRLVNKTELGAYYPNARARTDIGYVYGDHARFQSREYDLDNGASSVSAQVSNVPLQVNDKNNSAFMRLTARQLTDGTVRAMLEAAGTHTGSTVWNAICVDVRKDGSQHYGVNNAANFRSDLGINNASNLNAGTLAVAHGGTGATTAAAARGKLGAAAATWTSLGTFTGTNSLNLDLSNYHEVCIVCYYSTSYMGSIVLPKAAIHATTQRETYLTGSYNGSGTTGRMAACKLSQAKITGIQIRIDSTSYNGNWQVYAR